MKVEWDAIEPVRSARELGVARQRALEREQRQSRSMAQRREQLLDIAQKLIEKHGVEGLNMRLMARQAGYTPGALYAYFQGKEVILAALQHRVLERLALEAADARPLRLARGARSVAGQAGAELGGSEAQVQARARFEAQAMAWWSCLARDPASVQLLLLPSALLPAPSEGARIDAEFQGAPAGAAGLEDALHVCRQSLQAMGVSESLAYQLHREVVACGLGLLLLATASAHGQLASLEGQWKAALGRWLQGVGGAEAGAEDSAARSRQSDLFGV